MNTFFVLGIIAGILTAVAFVPQVLRVIKTKSTKDISLGMFILFCIGVVFWLVYGFLEHDWPLVVNSAVTLVLSLVILGYKIRYR